jgi:hypothetical protein
LANLTDGGEGTLNMSIDVRRRISDKNRANGCFDRHGRFLSNWIKVNGHPAKGLSRPAEYIHHKKTYAYDNRTGGIVGEFYSRVQAAKELGIASVSLISKVIKSGAPLKGFLLFNEYKGASVSIAKSRRSCKTVFKICPISGVVLNTFLSIKEAAQSVCAGASTMTTAIKGKTMLKGVVWSLDDSVNINEYRAVKSPSPIGIRKTECAACGGTKVGTALKYTYCHQCAAKRTAKYKKDRRSHDAG